jgi:hypothetical protein
MHFCLVCIGTEELCYPGSSEASDFMMMTVFCFYQNHPYLSTVAQKVTSFPTIPHIILK